MAKTNSNSITSILVAALNTEKSDFRTKMISIFSKKLHNKKINDDIVFYDCTHSPLLYEEMKETEIDIIARYPGIHKPIMMIEIKANIGEPLQFSQRENSYYLNTSQEHGIPLFYIIPRKYRHIESLPKEAIKIYWEDILSDTGNINVCFDTQITQFVEISDGEKYLSKEEERLFNNNIGLMQEIYKFKNDILKIMIEVLTPRRRINNYEETQWGVGYYYSYKRNNYFLGFNPYYNEKFDTFFALDIEETVKNFELGDRNKNPLCYDEGYYFIPILNNKTVDGDKIILEELRRKLHEKKVISISKRIKENFALFFSIQEKIGKDEMDKLFKEKPINEKQYEKLKKKFIR